jgi:alkanesulfonate monooxygenase SsuD/methylene tetrahydromethanopterin reductase-like flavin-dependent oxidoreductase (luciferase family)
MKFGDFLFPDSRDPERDGTVIDETLREASIADELGVDVIWLAEHHFDGICAYADPISFGSALAARTRRARLGFAVLQMALHDPIRAAEQIAVIDNTSKGRLTVGLGRGSSYNIYDYTGFGVDHHEAQARLDEAEEIIVRAWTEGEFAIVAGSGTWMYRWCVRAPTPSHTHRLSAPSRVRPRCSNWQGRGGRF